MNLSHILSLIVSRISQSYPAKVILLGLLYIFLGRLALLLAIPPGYAMAVYPPAGLALGAVLISRKRLALGVALGSLGLNLWIGYETGGGFSSTGSLLAFVIACGAALQALFGRWLIRRVVGYPAALDNNAAILGFMLLGGVSCWVNASIGVGALFGFGILSAKQVVVNWATWWVGDALGVFILAPVCLILAGEPAALWRSRRVSVLLPLLVTLVTVLGTFLVVREWEQRQFRIEFQETAQRVSNALQTRFDHQVEAHKSVVSLFTSIDNVSRAQFLSFVAQPVATDRSLQALEWVPRVMNTARVEFERQVQQQDTPGFAIRERRLGQLAPATARNEYYPIRYLSPLSVNEGILGYDLASEPVRQQTIHQARDTGVPIASPPLRILQNDQPSSLLISAVYDKILSPVDNEQRTREQRQATITGVVVSVLRVGDVLNAVLTDEDRRNILFHLNDAHTGAAVSPYFDTYAANKSAPLFAAKLHLAGRELNFTAHPSEAYFERHKSWAAWGSMVGGLLFTGLVCMYLLYASGRAHDVDGLVARRTQELNDSEQRLHTILDNAAEGILTFDEHGSVLLANRAACQLLEYSEPELAKQRFSSVFQSDANTLQAFDSQLVGSSNGIFKEVIAQRADGKPLEVGLSMAKLPRGKQTLFIVIIHDLSEKKRVERLKAEFVSVVSHELRTPLTSIRGALGLMAGGVVGIIPDSAKKLVQLAYDNAERLSVLINDILDFEKLEYGGLLFTMENHNLWEMVREALEMNQGYAEKFGITCVLCTETDPGISVQVDRSRLLQVLSNLMSNAIKFSRAQGTVTLKLDLADDWVTVWVIDHGIGISARFRSQIFDKFSQEDGSVQRKYAGTGLGLSLAKSMIEKMHGRIGFESLEGHGASFYIALPIAAPSV